MTTALDHVMQAHGKATRQPTSTIATQLQEILSRQVVAYLANVSEKTVTRWKQAQGEDIRLEAEQKLRVAFEITMLLERHEAARTIKAWFLGMNPYLDDISPAEAIRLGRYHDALLAARSFLATA